MSSIKICLFVFHCCPLQSDWGNRACMAADKSEHKLSPLPDTSFFFGPQTGAISKTSIHACMFRSMFTCEWIPAMQSYNQSTAQPHWDLRNFIALVAARKLPQCYTFSNFEYRKVGQWHCAKVMHRQIHKLLIGVQSTHWHAIEILCVDLHAFHSIIIIRLLGDSEWLDMEPKCGA